MLPYTEKEVAIHMINQFPSFADFGKEAIGAYRQLCDKILASNKESQTAAIESYQKILDALALRLEKTRISINKRKRKEITEEMISVADKIAELDWQNKRFLEKTRNQIGATILGIGALVGAGIGVFKFSNRG